MTTDLPPNHAKPRVLFLNRSYWPDTEATGQLLTALCEGLAENFEVHVLAGCPNSTTNHSEWKNINQINGVTIHRVKHTTFPKRNMALKAVNFLSFVNACRKHIRQLPPPDILVFETDPFLLPFVADRYCQQNQTKMVGYLQDIYPDVAVALKKVRNSWAIRWLRSKLFDIYSRCNKMVVLSKDMKQLLEDSDISKEKISIIPNWADTDQIVPIESNNKFRKKHSITEKFVAMYSGNLGLTQRLEDFIEAAAILKDDSEIQFVFVGEGARKRDLQELTKSLNLTNVIFCGYQPLDQLSHSLGAADIHLVPLTAELSQCLMPSKLYGILAAGRPILTNAPQASELYEVAKTNNVGFVVQAGSPHEIANAILAAKSDKPALAQMRVRARRLAEERYTKAHAVTAFIQLLTEVAQ